VTFKSKLRDECHEHFFFTLAEALETIEA